MALSNVSPKLMDTLLNAGWSDNLLEAAIDDAVMLRNQPELGEEILSEAAKQMSLKRTAVIVEPQQIISWDHTKLAATY